MNLLEQEFPLQPPFPQAPHWSENFCLASFDPRSGVGLWLHLGRWRKDINLWRETVVVHFPDGTTVAHRAIGRANAAPDGPGGPNFAIRVLEGGHRLRYTFEGGARRLKSELLRHGPLPDGPKDIVRFDVTFDSNAEIWDLHKVEKKGISRQRTHRTDGPCWRHHRSGQRAHSL